ncbi:hypothetical protein [Streptomyces sp. enrichment culture]|uniref:hypothetical protein n=1 Tax=Streptomyces sp. enrichment culture TaxID=1795815 RepID=UPI003F555572
MQGVRERRDLPPPARDPARSAADAGNLSVCGTCHADDIAREEAVAEAAGLQAAAPPEPEDDQEPGRGRGWFCRRA